ncbi:hypothetical protein ACHQM5_029463 [Ranunculus cassubicifolius]
MVNAGVDARIMFRECRVKCLNICLCMAYNSSGVRWFSILIDVKQVVGGGRDLYIVMAASELDSKANLWSCIAYNASLAWLTVPEYFDDMFVDHNKRGSRIEEYIELLQDKLALADDGIIFVRESKRIARSHGNLACAYMQQNDYRVAGQLYKEAPSMESGKNKQCNLAICLLNNGQFTEAESLLLGVTPSLGEREVEDPFLKSFGCSNEILSEAGSGSALNPHVHIWEPLILERPCNNSAMDWETSSRRLFERGTTLSDLMNVELANKFRTEVYRASNDKRDPIYGFQIPANGNWKKRPESQLIMAITPYNAAFQFGRPLIFGDYVIFLWILVVRTNVCPSLWLEFLLHQNVKPSDQLAKKGYLAASMESDKEVIDISGKVGHLDSDHTLLLGLAKMCLVSVR